METPKDLTKYFIDLSKCSEEEIKSLPLILENESIYFDDKRLFKKGKYNLDYPLFYFGFSNQWIGGDKTTNQKRSELTYPEFIKLFEGGEGENETFRMDEMIAFGKKCFYKGFDKCETDDANCYTAWREEAGLLIEQIKH